MKAYELKFEDFKGLTTEQALEKLSSLGVEKFEYEEENEDFSGTLYVPSYWADHFCLEFFEGMVDCGGFEEWD